MRLAGKTFAFVCALVALAATLLAAAAAGHGRASTRVHIRGAACAGAKSAFAEAY